MRKKYDDEYLACENADVVISRDRYDDIRAVYKRDGFAENILQKSLYTFIAFSVCFVFYYYFRDIKTIGFVSITIPFIIIGIIVCSITPVLLGLSAMVFAIISSKTGNSGEWYHAALYGIPSFVFAVLYTYYDDMLEKIFNIPMHIIRRFSRYSLGSFNRNFDKAYTDDIKRVDAQTSGNEYVKAIYAEIKAQGRIVTRAELLKIETLYGEVPLKSGRISAEDQLPPARIEKCQRCNLYKRCPIKPGGSLESIYKGSDR